MAIFSSTKTLITLLACLLSAANVNGAILPRAVLPHDKVVGFPQTVPAGSAGDTYLKYQPLLKVVNGCVPFPAVDAAGNTGGGLKPSGSSNGGCTTSSGQVYVRSAAYGTSTALMYAWYFPKDEPSDGIGHRHDWECVVVWVDSLDPANQQLLGAAPSAHGGFSPTRVSGVSLSGNHPEIDYKSDWPLDHSLRLGSSAGGSQPLVAWESLPAAAQAALINTDFGAANVPFIDKNFQNNLAKAALT